MALYRVNNKYRNIRVACASSTLGHLSNNKFLKDYYKLVIPYLDDSANEIRKTPNIDVLLNLAEQDFIQSYGAFPTCAVYAPGCLTIAGKCTNLAESKSLSMSICTVWLTLFVLHPNNPKHVKKYLNQNFEEELWVTEIKILISNVVLLNTGDIEQLQERLTKAVQLVTLIVGKRSHHNKWCHVKTLLDQFAEQNIYRFYLNEENLQVSMEEPSWIRYIKATIQCFKAKRVTVPGFEIVIVSTLPIKCGLGSSAALVVAMYTFLEAITNTHTTNLLEKTLVCYLAQRLASGSQHHHIADSLISIIGNEDKLIAFSSRSLTIGNYDFSETIDVEMVLIEFPNFDLEESSKYRLNASHQKEISVIRNTKSRWRTNPEGASMMERLFSQETMALTENILNEDKRISEMIQAIQTKRWKKLGKLLWKNYQYIRKSLNVLPEDIERVMTALESAEYVLGASFISRGRGASVFVLVQRSRFRSFISLMNSVNIPAQRYYKIKSFTGATILYTHERHVTSNDAEPHRRYRQTLKAKYYLRDEDSTQLDDKYFIPSKSTSFSILTKNSSLTN